MTWKLFNKLKFADKLLKMLFLDSGGYDVETNYMLVNYIISTMWIRMK